MTMKEKLQMHKRIEAENNSKLELWMRYEYARRVLGFRPSNLMELQMYECNGYDLSILMYQ